MISGCPSRDGAPTLEPDGIMLVIDSHAGVLVRYLYYRIVK